MNETVFLAGAAGAIGTMLAPLLVSAGYVVYGTTRRAERCAAIEAAGARPVLVDVFDRAALAREVEHIAPAIVVHQLTDLPAGLDSARMKDAITRNARIRDEGTRNLVAAARAAGCAHIVAQSIAWAYAPGPEPYTEDRPLDTAADGDRAITIGGVIALETHVLGAQSPRSAATVLRYGNLYGPGTGRAAPTGASPLHVEAAAWAALLAVQRSPGGIFNVADDRSAVDSTKAKRVLGWDPTLRLPA
ncbi:dTDP-glucose 4,6-dehydratase [Burkholderia singularis]|uniref:dTDP-glucose 4,6-dehydratase n=1 Tax=Burkholderia singularis TaxID=1503053 RepID=A0A103E5Q2_9BURK|nr:NAD(P)-dependent oxidoreductase [Burkholderia singularis]KVE28843.1 dTDP-glucose 4,6-dehydratase [Burkholderia singularis]